MSEDPQDPRGKFADPLPPIAPCPPFGEGRRVPQEWLDALEQLAYRERRILELRFGTGGIYGPQTLAQVAEVFNVTEERIRQIEAQAIRKLEQLTGVSL